MPTRVELQRSNEAVPRRSAVVDMIKNPNGANGQTIKWSNVAQTKGVIPRAENEGAHVGQGPARRRLAVHGQEGVPDPGRTKSGQT